MYLHHEKALSGVDSAYAQLAVRKSERYAAEAFVKQQRSELYAT